MFLSYFQLKVKEYALCLFLLQFVVIVGLVAFGYLYPNFIASRTQMELNQAQDFPAHTFIFEHNNKKRWQKLESKIINFKNKIESEENHKDKWQKLLETSQTLLEIGKKHSKFLQFLKEQLQRISNQTNLREEEQFIEIENWLKNNDWHQKIADKLWSFQHKIQNETNILNTKIEGNIVQFLPVTKENAFVAIKDLDLEQGFDYAWQMQLILNVSETAILNILEEYIDLILYTQVDCWLDLIISPYHATVVPHSSVIQQGDVYESMIRLVREGDLKIEYVTIGGDTLKSNHHGQFVYQAKANEIGKFSFKGAVFASNNQGEVKNYPFVQFYTVISKCQ